MGVVYRATQLALDRPVALKVIAPDLAGDADFRARFQRESRLAASIEHPNVLPVYEAGRRDGLAVHRDALRRGHRPRALLRARARSTRRARPAPGAGRAALDAAHRRGLVHRDVKPANVLITGDAVEHVYLADFGLSKSGEAGGG